MSIDTKLDASHTKAASRLQDKEAKAVAKKSARRARAIRRNTARLVRDMRRAFATAIKQANKAYKKGRPRTAEVPLARWQHASDGSNAYKRVERMIAETSPQYPDWTFTILGYDGSTESEDIWRLYGIHAQYS